MPAIRETYTRVQGNQNMYDVEYTNFRYVISLNGKVLKSIKLPIHFGTGSGGEASWQSAISDIEYLRGMAES